MGDYFWTEHSLYKMKQYGLSEQRIRRVIRAPFRTEEGIVPETVAVMQPASAKTIQGKPAWNKEIWVMYTIRKAKNSKSETRNPKQIQKLEAKKLIGLQANKLKIISAWRYPGVSPKRNPIPEEILREIQALK